MKRNKQIKHINIILLFICILGTIITLLNVVFFGLRSIHLFENAFSNFILQNTAVDVGYLNPIVRKYTYADQPIKQYQNFIYEIEQTVTNFCSTSFPENDKIYSYSQHFKSHILKDNLDKMSFEDFTSDSLKLEYKYIEDFQNQINISSLRWNNKLINNDKPQILYVSAPSGNKQAADNSLIFCEMLENDGILSLNLSDKLNNQLDFDASGHWANTSALYATKLIEEKLGISTFELSSENYYDILEDYPDVKNSIHSIYNQEYQLPISKSLRNTFYKCQINEVHNYQGDFENIFLSSLRNWEEANFHSTPYAYYNLWTINNATLFDIENTSTSASNLTILVLGDSFSWPVVAYLSTNNRHVVYMNPSVFSHCAKSYSNKLQPDIILILYNDLSYNTLSLFEDLS